MQLKQRVKLHLQEANIHATRIKEALNSLVPLFPLNEESFEVLTDTQKDKLDVLAFRFAKLQDLLGSKIFREFLELMEYPTADKNFFDLLKELEKENIVNIDLWSEFRSVRNAISHDYPFEISEKIEAINYLIQNIQYLIDVTNAIGKRVEA